MDTAELELGHFAPLVEETFIADFGDEGTLDLVLTESVECPTGNTEATAFSLVFRGPTDRAFQQTMVPIHHDSIGTHPLLLVAIDETSEGRFYEAVFTRLRNS